MALALLVAALPGALAEQRIDARALGFAPERALAADWETVRWVWPAGETHGVASNATGELWCAPAEGGCLHYFSRVGAFAYHCPLHPEMHGVVVVERRSGEAAAALHAFFFVHSQGLTATFDASSVARSRTAIESYEWDLGDNTSGAGQIVEHGYARAGTYVVRLTVVDELGNEDTGARRVEVRASGDREAHFRAKASGRAVVFDADPLAGPHAWDFGDGARVQCGEGCEATQPDTVAATPTSLVHVYRRGGGFLVNHTTGPFWSSSLVTVTAPETFEVAADGLEVKVDATALPRYGNATIEWLFGDLDRAEGERATHVFPKAGLWSIEVTLRDEVGQQTLEREMLLAPARAEETLIAAALSPQERAREDVPSAAAMLTVVALALAAFSRSERYK